MAIGSGPWSAPVGRGLERCADVTWAALYWEWSAAPAAPCGRLPLPALQTFARQTPSLPPTRIRRTCAPIGAAFQWSSEPSGRPRHARRAAGQQLGPGRAAICGRPVPRGRYRPAPTPAACIIHGPAGGARDADTAARGRRARDTRGAERTGRTSCPSRPVHWSAPLSGEAGG